MMRTNLYFLKQVEDCDEVNLLILLDLPRDGDSKVMVVTHGSTTEVPLEEVDPDWGDEVNMGDPEVLDSFLRWGVERFPAVHYNIHLSDHGGGWRGMCWDDTSDGDNLDLPEIEGSLFKFQELTGDTVDIFSTEGCLVGMLEFAYQIRDVAKYYLGGETYGMGGWNNSGTFEAGNWCYDKTWGRLVSNPGMTPEEFAVVMVEEFNSIGPWVYPPMIPKPEFSDVMAAMDLSKVGALAEASDKLATEILQRVNGVGQVPAERNLINNVISTPERHPEQYTESFSGMMDWIGVSSYTNYDLSDFAYQLSKPSAGLLATGGTCQMVQALVNEVVIALAHGTTASLGEHVDANGISIYIPYRSSEYNPKYEETAFAQDTNWDEFINAVTWT